VLFDIEKLENMGLEVIKKEIATIQSGVVRHESNKVAKWLFDYAFNAM
jgi:hypothetical protein